MAKDSEAKFKRLVAKFAPAIRKEFEKAFVDIKTSTDIKRLVAAIEARRIDEALDILRMGPEFFSSFEAAILAAYGGGAQYELDLLPKRRPDSGTALVVRFQGRHRRAESWAATNVGDRIAEIIAEQRSMVREYIQTGIREGFNPRKTALDLVGRVDRLAGKRVGGVIGLTRREAGYVTSARAELEALDPNYLDRQLRHKGFDRMFKARLKSGKKLSQTQINRIADRYSDKLLKARGDRVARTETIKSLNAGKQEAFLQLSEQENIPEEAMSRTWNDTGDGKVRDSHNQMDGQKVGLNEPFITPTGYQLMYPGDGNLGAPAAEIIHCRCWVSQEVDWLSLAA